MKFKQLLNEKYIGSGMFHGLIKDLYENPTSKELKDILKDSHYNTIRLGITDKKKPTIYAWDGNILHFIAEKPNAFEDSKGNFITIKFDFGFIYTPENKKYPLWWDNVIGRDWEKLKNKKEMIGVIKKMFPKVKIIKGNVYDVQLENN